MTLVCRSDESCMTAIFILIQQTELIRRDPRFEKFSIKKNIVNCKLYLLSYDRSESFLSTILHKI